MYRLVVEIIVKNTTKQSLNGTIAAVTEIATSDDVVKFFSDQNITISADSIKVDGDILFILLFVF